MTNELLPKMNVYTDGSCKHNPGPGGWAWVRMVQGQELEYGCGGEAQTTNNRMELIAVVKALEKFAAARQQLQLFTDSTYVQQGLQHWLANWKRRKWRTAAGKPVKNQDLWQRLDGLYDDAKVKIVWVKGHADNPGNERADYYAQQQALLQLESAAS